MTSLANPNLSAQSAPVLDEILEDVERLAKAPSESIRALAREARMVLTVRLASASTVPSDPAREPEEDQIRSTYQRALKLLQDALLPVRAHGLLLLRELVTTRTGIAPHEVVRTLEPAIRDIFLQAVQDDDSYIFLNAVQGLSALADSFGSQALSGLVAVYAGGLQGVGAGALTQQDVDMRLRVGEALGQVIRRCGETLPRYGQFPPSARDFFLAYKRYIFFFGWLGWGSSRRSSSAAVFARSQLASAHDHTHVLPFPPRDMRRHHRPRPTALRSRPRQRDARPLTGRGWRVCARGRRESPTDRGGSSGEHGQRAHGGRREVPAVPPCVAALPRRARARVHAARICLVPVQCWHGRSPQSSTGR